MSFLRIHRNIMVIFVIASHTSCVFGAQAAAKLKPAAPTRVAPKAPQQLDDRTRFNNSVHTVAGILGQMTRDPQKLSAAASACDLKRITGLLEQLETALMPVQMKFKSSVEANGKPKLSVATSPAPALVIPQSPASAGAMSASPGSNPKKAEQMRRWSHIQAMATSPASQPLSPIGDATVQASAPIGAILGSADATLPASALAPQASN